MRDEHVIQTDVIDLTQRAQNGRATMVGVPFDKYEEPRDTEDSRKLRKGCMAKHHPKSELVRDQSPRRFCESEVKANAKISGLQKDLEVERRASRQDMDKLGVEVGGGGSLR